jgi:hypothetical protein
MEKDPKNVNPKDLIGEEGAEDLVQSALFERLCCISELRKNRLAETQSTPFDEKWLSQGSGSIHANFRNWIFVEMGMRVIFDPYAVDCYASDRQSVDLSISHPDSILKPQFLQALS